MTSTGARPMKRRTTTRRNRPGASKVRAAWLFLTPSLLVLLIFAVWPMARALYLSFTNYNSLQPPEWIGIDNYVRMFGDPRLINALANTLLYAVIATLTTIVLAMVLASMLNRRFPLRGFLRTAVFLPYITSLSVVAIAWSFLLNPEIGVLSSWLGALGIAPGQGILRDPDTAFTAILVVGIWKNLGFYTIIYLAGIQSIPRELYEAAETDGAGPLRRFRSLTVPLLSNQTMLVSVMATITNVQVFDQVYVMTQGGPFFTTDTLVNLLYRSGFENLEFGYASAVSWLLVIILLILALVQLLYFRKRAVSF